MLMGRTDLDGNNITFTYHEVQGLGPYGQYSYTNGRLERCYDVPIFPGLFQSPADAFRQIKVAFLGYSQLSADGRRIQRMPPLADPTDPALFYTSVQRIEPVGYIKRAELRDDCDPSYAWRVSLVAQHLTYDPLDDASIAGGDDGQ